MTNTNIIKSKANLATLSIGGWSGRRYDRDISGKVVKDNHAHSDAARVNKLLVDGARINKVAKIAGEARNEHYRITLPWFDDGARVLPNALFMQHAKMNRELQAKYFAAADDFVKDYPQMIEDARKNRMGDLFKESDYPPPEQMRSLFTFKVWIFPCPDAADFRSDLPAEIMDDIKTDLDERMKTALNEAMKMPIKRIIDVVNHMAVRLGEYKPSTRTLKASPLYESMVDNVRDLVELLPAFNLTGDKALDDLTKRMRDELCVHSVSDMKDSHGCKVRKEVKRSADEILAAANMMMAG